MNKGKLIDADKLKEAIKNRVAYFPVEYKDLLYKIIDELSEEREQPNPLKVAIKGDGTEEYGKKIIEYFTSFGCTNNNEFSCYDEDFYYFMNEENNLWWEFNLPEGYTEISLKEEEKESEVECNFNIISDEVKAEYVRHRVKWLEIDNAALSKELTEIKLKLKDLSK